MYRRFPALPVLLLVAGCQAGTGADAAAEADVARVSETSPAAAPAASDRKAAETEPTVVFLGTSLTAGYGIGADRAYPAHLQQKIDSAGLDYRVVNAGVSGETSAGGLRRLDWILQQPVDVLVLELGANDGLRGQDTKAMRKNLQEIIDRTRAANPDVRILIAGMEAPPNLGRRYTGDFRDVFRDLAEENDAALVPFLLEGVAGDPAMNQADRIHPNPAGARRLAENVWSVLEPLLRDADG